VTGVIARSNAATSGLRLRKWLSRTM
jgi:hypothetical protein